ncbi:MAG: anaerobic ribonucleoside-triphosphate reductase activating protein [Lachnospiraceae bacterium]|nr:anaerobic ribonucleoside-triphosphate reductase activating protein [Lachnospiraceae bacterium]
MNIYGLMKTTLLDYPGKVASTIFLGGCNLRCPFCHNMDLVTGLDQVEPLSYKGVIEHLNLRKGVIDGVCITGGEPTLQPDLADLISEIKNIGLLVKLDSNGTQSGVLADLLAKNLLDYIAIDIKASFNNYQKVCGLTGPEYDENYVKSIVNNVKKTISMLIKGNSIPYEFRTTVVREYHDTHEFELIADMLKGADAYYLQSFVSSEFVPDKTLHAYTKRELQDFADLLSSSVKTVGIRGVD